MSDNKKKVIIFGAGPAGLALAYELLKKETDVVPILIEKNSVVGGISRTVYDGELGVDIGGHRLYSKNSYINKIWTEFLPLQNYPSADDIHCQRDVTYPKNGANPNKEDKVMLIRKRFSSIIYNSTFFPYPLKLDFDTFSKLGVMTSIIAGFSYLKSLIFKRKELTLEDFMINRFGKVLYNIFFKDYTKKVWGKDPSLMPADWGKERIKKLSLFKTVINAIFSNFEFFKKLSKETSLIDEFYYPKLGCSQLWNLMADYIVAHGGQILLNHEVFDFEVTENKMLNAKVKYTNGKVVEIQGDYFVSSMPICDLIKGLDAPYNIKQYALNLPYRDYLLVSFYTNSFNLKNQTNYRTVNNITPECWIYLQEPDAVASRIQIMNNWSPYLVGDFRRNYLISLEYYLNEDDFLWNLDDGKIIELALNECKKYNLFFKKDVLKANVIREKKAYPAYWGSYHKLNEIKKYLSTINNLYLIGRNGQHKYNNMDEAMLSGIYVAREIIKKLGK